MRLLTLTLLLAAVAARAAASPAASPAPSSATPASAPASGNTPSPETPPVLRFTVNSLDGKPVDLSRYQGKVLLIVNTASKCGLTPQYEGLEKLSASLAPKGLAVLGFPCNQFGQQEPGTSTDIREFCTKNYGVTFDMFEKLDVNGEHRAPLYAYLTSQDTAPAKSGDIQWNFEKFLIARDGHVAARFSPKTPPDDPALRAAVDAELAK